MCTRCLKRRGGGGRLDQGGGGGGDPPGPPNKTPTRGGGGGRGPPPSQRNCSYSRAEDAHRPRGLCPPRRPRPRPWRPCGFGFGGSWFEWLRAEGWGVCGYVVYVVCDLVFRNGAGTTTRHARVTELRPSDAAPRFAGGRKECVCGRE
jgi:hypothetical protein